MNPASRTLPVLRALLLFAFVLATSACEAKDRTPTPTDLPASLLGTWQVSDVRLDQGDSRPWAYKFNVHKYLGRIFVLTPERLTYNMKWWVGDEQQVCEAPGITVRRTTAFKVVSNSIGRPFQTGPSPKDFGLPLADNVRVEVLSLYCRGKLMGNPSMDYEKLREKYPDPDHVLGIWFIFLNPDELAMSWHDGVFLILKRLPKDAKPLASFDCTRAATDTEKAVCGSVALAAFDASIAGTYKHALDYYDYALRTYDPRIKPQTVKQMAAFKQSQKEWLRKRDACGSDAACLERAMGERILDIDREIADYAYDNRIYDLRHAGENFGKPYAERRW